ncbi:aminoglycoside phosphotransferase family protein [Nocardioides sp. W7]|uniref:aminoglycoside phosphotransferase family protein n=1 Tax=Nocardioides sp. W7 TaxID=2931390 RepID=UPI001FD616DB|nr:aminoglycoside phosphotransferase family protein [Nocardioides sp. W7]
MDEQRWTDPAWLATAYDWVDEQLGDLGLTRTGAVEQPHVARWSTVLRVPTDAGAVFFKANQELLRHEAAVVGLLAARVPDRVPPLLAVDAERGWMLMADAGETLRVVSAREESLERWYDALGAVARIQLAVEDDVDALLAMGVPDHRLAGVPAGYARLMDEIDAEPRFRTAQGYVEELCAELASYGIPDSIQHDDLHDAQVFVQDGADGGRQLVMDWGDACVSQPFCVLSVALEGVIAWGLDDVEDSVDTAPFRDAYLAPWAARLPGVDLAAAVMPAVRLGWAIRAVNGHLPGDVDQTVTRLRMFLDGRA